MKFLSFLMTFFLFLSFAQAQEKNDTRYLFEMGKYEELIKSFEHVKNDTLQESDLICLAIAQQKLLRFPQSIATLQILLNKDSLNIFYEKLTGESYEALRLYDEAIAHFLKAKRIDSTDNVITLKLGGLFYKKKDFQKSVSYYFKALQSDSTNSYILRCIAEIYCVFDSTNLSTEYFTKSLDYLNIPYTVNEASDYLIKMNKIDKALNILDTYAANTQHIELLKNYGICYYMKQEYEIADSIFQMSLELGDSSLVILNYMGIIKYQLKDFETAETYLSRALKKDSTNIDMKTYYGAVLCRNYSVEKGIQILAKCISDLQPSKDILFFINSELANAYLIQGEKNKALESYNLCLDYTKSKSYIYYKIAEIYDYEVKDKKEAYNQYQRLIVLLKNKVPETLTPQENMILLTCEYRVNLLKEELFFENRLE